MYWNTSVCLTAAVTFRHINHPPCPFSIALSHRCFSKLMAFFRRATSSTARFLLHRKFVRRLARSVSRGTWASENEKKMYCIWIKCQNQQNQQSLQDYLLWITEQACVWSSIGRCKVFKLDTPGCFRCTCPCRKSTCGCAAVLTPCKLNQNASISWL